MTCPKRILVLVAVAMLGAWGCVPSASHSANIERLRALEVKNTKLEDDFRAVAATRDQLRKQLADNEEQMQQLQQQVTSQVQTVTRERDELRQQLNQRTSERDALTVQFEQFRKGIKELLGQADAAATRSSDHPVTSAVEVVPPGKS